MAVMSEIIDEVSIWIDDSKVSSLIPGFIRRGQRMLEDRLRIRALEYRPADGTLLTGVNTITLPADYIELMFLTILDGASRYTMDMNDRYSPQAFYERFRDPATSNTGRPIAFTRIGDLLYLDQYADQDYTYEYAYFRHLSTLTNDTDTNWWTTNAEQALLIAAVNQAIPYYRASLPDKRFSSDPRFTTWQNLLLVELDQLRVVDTRERGSGVKMRVKYHD